MTPADDIFLPPTRREVVTDNLHGTEIPDPYRWLENDTEAVQEWTDTQNEYTNSHLDTPAHDKLRPVMQELAEVTEYGTVKVGNDRYFQTIESPEDDHPRLLVRQSQEDEGVVLVDPNEWQANNDEGTPTRSMSWFLPAYDGEHVAYGVTEGGDEQNDIHVVTVPDSEEVATLEDCGRVSPGLISFDAVSPGMVAWDGDSEGLYYVATGDVETGTQMEKELRYWQFDGSEETLLEHDDTVWPTVRTDPESGMLAVGFLEMGVGIDWHVQIDGEFRPVITDNDSETFVMFHDGTVFLQTDHEAPHKRVLSCSLARFCEGCEFAECKTVLPERESILQSFAVTPDHLVVHYQKDAHSRLSVYSHDGEHVRDLPLPDYASVSQLRSNVDAEEVFYRRESFHQPPTIVQTDPASGEQHELARTDSERLPDDLVVHQEFVESSDGAEVPVFICHREGIELDGDNPAVLYGYGGFRKNMTPSFDRFRLPFLADGGVYAQVCTRGGQEYGEEWHKEGMLADKQHTFDDFIAAGEYLCTADYTNPERLAVAGRSNGGLSVGAVVTQRPDLWAAARCAVPLLDMLRFHRFLLGESWTTEYGHPEDPEAFEYIREYSPYHNVESGIDYPSVLFTTAVKDSRVHPSHVRKMTAHMQNEADGGPFLLRTKTETGHGSDKPTSMIVTEKTDEWTFLYDQLGMSE